MIYHWKSLLLTFGLSLLLCVNIFSSVSLVNDQEIEIREIGQFDTPGRVRDVVVIGEIAYLADMGRLPIGTNARLLTLDISNPYQPTKLGEFASDGSPHHIFVDALRETAFVADNIGGLKIISVSDPTSLTEIGHFDGVINDLDVVDNTIYAVDYVNGLIVLDSSNLTHPTEITRFTDFKNAQPIDIFNNYVYVTDRNGLTVLDGTNHSNIEELARFHYSAYNIDFDDSTAYMACDNGFFICNISNPLNITEIGSSLNGSYLIDVYVKEDLAIISDKNEGIKVLNISDPSHPVQIAHYFDGGDALDFFIEDDLIYVADGEDGLEILQISGLTSKSTETIPGFQFVFLLVSITIVLTRRKK